MAAKNQGKLSILENMPPQIRRPAGRLLFLFFAADLFKTVWWELFSDTDPAGARYLTLKLQIKWLLFVIYYIFFCPTQQCSLCNGKLSRKTILTPETFHLLFSPGKNFVTALCLYLLVFKILCGEPILLVSLIYSSVQHNVPASSFR